jgi:hypothetical protein
MNDTSSLSDTLRQLAYYQAGGQPEGGRDIDKLNQSFGIIDKTIADVLAIKKAKLEQEKSGYETRKLKREITPENVLGDKTIEERLKAAQADYYGSGQKGGKKLFVNPTTRELSEIPLPGYFEVSSNTAATIAAGPAKEASTAARQEQSQLRGAEIKEASENRAKNKADLNQIEQIQNNLVQAKGVLDKIPSGIAGGAEGLLSKTGLGFSDASTYERTKPALATSLYRAMTGDTRLSDSDAAARALPLLPSLHQNAEQRKQLFDFINKTIENRKQKLNEGINEIPWDSIIGNSQPQVRQQRVKDGVTYEKREDGLWHPLGQ